MSQLIEAIVVGKIYHGVERNSDGKELRRIKVQPGDRCFVSARELERFPTRLILPNVHEAQQQAEEVKQAALATLKAEAAAETGPVVVEIDEDHGDSD